MKISELIAAIKAQYQQPPDKRVSLFVQGQPGVGKSMAAEQAARELSIGHMAMQATIEDPITLSGLPAREGNHAVFLTFKDKLPTHGEGVLVIEEINCFPAGTRVTVVREARDVGVPIEAVTEGEMVVCTDLHTGGRSVNQCLGVVRYGPKETLVRITTDDGRELCATPNHHVYTDRGWVAIAKLKAGDLVYRLSNMRNVDGSDHVPASGRASRDDDGAVPAKVSGCTHAAAGNSAYGSGAGRGHNAGGPGHRRASKSAGEATSGLSQSHVARGASGGGGEVGSKLSTEFDARREIGASAQGRYGDFEAAPGAICAHGGKIGRVLEFAARISASFGAREENVGRPGPSGKHCKQEPASRNRWTYPSEVEACPSLTVRVPNDRLYREGEAAVAICRRWGISCGNTERRMSRLAEPGFSRDRATQGCAAGFTVSSEPAARGSDGLSEGRLGNSSGCGAGDDRRAMVKTQNSHVCLVRVAGIRTERHEGFVYDLTIAGCHNYFASGFLVHNTAPPLVQAGFYSLFLLGQLGSYKLPPGWYVIATGNRDEDRAATQRIPMPLIGRWCRVKIEADLADWTQWALLNDVLPEVVTFFQHRPELFNTFDPSRAEPYCCARTAVFASRLIRSAPAGLEYELLGGVVGDGVATELTAFLRVWRDMIDPDDVIKTPETAPLPKEPAATYAIAGALAHRATPDNFARILAYANRLQPEYGVLLVKLATKRDVGLCTARAFVDWASKHRGLLS